MVSGSTETPQVQHGLSLEVLLFILHNTDPPDRAVTGFSNYHNDFITRGMMSSGNKTWGSPARMSWPLGGQSHALPHSPPGDTATYTTCSSRQTPSKDITFPAPASAGTTGSPDKVFWINRLFSPAFPQTVPQLHRRVPTDVKVSEGKRVEQGLTWRILLLLKWCHFPPPPRKYLLLGCLHTEFKICIIDLHDSKLNEFSYLKTFVQI